MEVAKKGIWGRFIHMLVRSKLPYAWMIAAFVFSIVKSSIELIVPQQIAKVLGNELSVSLLLVIFVLGLLNAIFTFSAETVKNIALQKIDRNMQRMGIAKIFYLKLKDVEKNDPRELVSRITTDTTFVSTLLLELVINEIPRIYFMVSSVIILFRNYDRRLALVMLVTIPITILGSWITGNLTFTRMEAVQAKVAKLTATLAEKINNLQIIKSYNNEDKETERGGRVISELNQARRDVALVTRLKDFVNTLVNLIPVVVIVVVGAVYLLEGTITVPTFVVFYQYSSTFIGYVTAHLALWVTAKTAQGATARLAAVLDLEDECVEDESAKDRDLIVTGDIAFHDVSFSYGEKTVLDHVSFTVPKGGKTAFVGYSGSGKSTVLNLIEAFYRPESGSITMGGVDICSYAPQNYRKLFTYVPQNAPGFSGTIREFLSYGRNENISDEALCDALKRANALDMVNRLDYYVGENASKLSGGQKQKLSVARAFLSDTEYMLLDEATSALDINSTDMLQGEINRKMSGRTQILVAHNLSTVVNADKIILFDKGNVAAEGTYQELMKNSKLFQELASSWEEGKEQ